MRGCLSIAGVLKGAFRAVRHGIEHCVSLAGKEVYI
jgi:hypothetical protein